MSKVNKTIQALTTKHLKLRKGDTVQRKKVLKEKDMIPQSQKQTNEEASVLSNYFPICRCPAREKQYEKQVRQHENCSPT